MGYVESICISHKKGIVKKEIKEANFIKDYGIEGDAHAGKWHRQVSLLAGESIDKMKEKIPSLQHGAFAENLVLRQVDFSRIRVGDLLRIGDSVLLEVTQIGKECHTSCAIKKIVGDCIMPREGLFARILQGGAVRTGQEVCVLTQNETTVKQAM
ncbi:MOSC domain containing protein [Caldithrix abyssi DSM 13497]|uniref:MOSC domain-containing protein n=1 Tax=Caldithrix abyssi DSM 13497 TaxID=880073 RepID=H1XTX2_CALAY|nr:MOSC domain-containing protein [Caldithrix abyssi]APF18760.1 MOSC domain-containing protein [Caldithrix abyssi DSM 13497]EHO42739.1 MOSC domain containing protein [Caldithrix abyssi DSM 13497]